MTYHSYNPSEIADMIQPILAKHQIVMAAVFGSAARGEMCRGSDIDLIIDPGTLSSGLKFIELKRKIENRLGRKVDLISSKSLDNSKLKDQILQEAVVIYEQKCKPAKSYS
jgi:uncharacterized protein